MNKLIRGLGVLLLFGCKRPEHKYFTGTVEYAYTYSSDSLNADSLERARPAKGILRYDTLNYQSKFISSVDTNTNYYSGLHNKCLSQTNDTGNYECLDYD